MRRTKQQSQQTRLHILSAARREFARRGVTRTSLEHIASAAGVTRGAIYWHFANKMSLFNAMREQVSLPLIDRTDLALLKVDGPDPLSAIEAFLHALIELLQTDSETRRTFHIMSLKCEYVDEFGAELKRQMRHCRELLPKLAAVYERAQTVGTLKPGLSPALAALDTCIFTTGLLRLWLLDEKGALTRPHVDDLIGAHVASKRSESTPRSESTTPCGHRPALPSRSKR